MMCVCVCVRLFICIIEVNHKRTHQHYEVCKTTEVKFPLPRCVNLANNVSCSSWHTGEFSCIPRYTAPVFVRVPECVTHFTISYSLPSKPRPLFFWLVNYFPFRIISRVILTTYVSCGTPRLFRCVCEQNGGRQLKAALQRGKFMMR